MAKNIVICCDGTSNQYAAHNTNVIKLYGVLSNDPAKQITYYHPGLGTMEAVGAITNFSKKLRSSSGSRLATGSSPMLGTPTSS